MSDEARARDDAAAEKPLLKLLIELGPLVAFFAAYAKAGIYWATGTLMIATVVALVASWRVLGRISMMPVATAALVVVFGGLTFWLDDPSFIKMKPTMINLLFAAILLGGMWMRRPVLKSVLGQAFDLTEAGWQKLSARWAAFFVGMAALNEVVWRNFPEATWVSFKVFGILPLTIVFALLQVGLIKRYDAKAGA